MHFNWVVKFLPSDWNQEMKQDSLQIPDKNMNVVVAAEGPTFTESLHVM
jgi:hypothetical protein